MQVSIAFAEAHAETNTYPYPVRDTIRHEVFTRRGGMYFGIAHLLDYRASYDQVLYRFADFNAGHYASRNAAFQNAVSMLSGIALDLDGDLVRYGQGTDDRPGRTELATMALAKRLGMSTAAIRRDLQRGGTEEFEHTRLYERVFSLADQVHRARVARAVVPRIRLQSAKITRNLTTEWFASRVDERRKRCLVRVGSTSERPQQHGDRDRYSTTHDSSSDRIAAAFLASYQDRPTDNFKPADNETPPSVHGRTMTART
jgi:hypothetical protein